jgi:hypothetical protein
VTLSPLSWPLLEALPVSLRLNGVVPVRLCARL